MLIIIIILLILIFMLSKKENFNQETFTYPTNYNNILPLPIENKSIKKLRKYSSYFYPQYSIVPRKVKLPDYWHINE